MIICIDFDGTYTADPILWNHFIETAKSHGHDVVCATMRYPTENDPIETLLEGRVSEIIYTCRKAKKEYVTTHLGKKPDIWIDDNPDWLYEDAL